MPVSMPDGVLRSKAVLFITTDALFMATGAQNVALTSLVFKFCFTIRKTCVILCLF